MGDWAPALVGSGAMLLALPVALLAGLVSFFSPCVVPLLPGYRAYATGMSVSEIGAGTAGRGRRLAGTALFVAGFATVFVTAGVVFGVIGQALLAWQRPLTIVAGVVSIALGLMFAGVLPLDRRELRWQRLPAVGLGGAPLLGMVFGLGWTASVRRSASSSTWPHRGQRQPRCAARVRLRGRPRSAVPGRRCRVPKDHPPGRGSTAPPGRAAAARRRAHGARRTAAAHGLVGHADRLAPPMVRLLHHPHLTPPHERLRCAMAVHRRPGSRTEPSVQLPHPAVTAISYPSLLRPSEPDPHRWARAVVGVTLGLTIFLAVSPAVAATITAAGWWVTGEPGSFPTYADAAADFERPIGMAAANLSIAVVLIPVSVVLVRVWHHGQPGRLVSVRGRFRWRWLGACLAISLPVYGALLLLAGDLPSPSPTPAAATAGFVAVIVLTSPLQAAAEEVFFRGYLTQAVGTLTAGPWPAILVSSLIFALLHGNQNLPLFVNRFAFGLLAGTLAWATGGLEAPIAAHVVNNVLAYGAATFTGTVAELRRMAVVTWPVAMAGVAGYAAYTVAAVLAARRRLDRTAPPLALERR